MIWKWKKCRRVKSVNVKICNLKKRNNPLLFKEALKGNSAARSAARRGLAHVSWRDSVIFATSSFPSVKSLSCDGVSHESPNAL
jgi:hypothetical protein